METTSLVRSGSTMPVIMRRPVVLNPSQHEPRENFTEAIIIPDAASETDKSPVFIGANTTAVTLEQLKSDYIIPVFAKDNKECISHNAFISTGGRFSIKPANLDSSLHLHQMPPT